jgi:hypothetical protein
MPNLIGHESITFGSSWLETIDIVAYRPVVK